MPVNLNGVGKSAGARLARGPVGSRLADAILAERDANGDFISWNDLIKRVKGFGPVKRDALILHGFEVKHRPVVEEKQVDEAQEQVDGTNSVRDPGVRVRELETWRYRTNKDLYTGLTRSDSEREGKIQVDHVVEIQVLNLVHSRTAFLARCTRASERVLQRVVNSAVNLNCTTLDINQKKKGPIGTWVNEYTAALEGGVVNDNNAAVSSLTDVARDSPAGRALIDDGIWAHIEGGIVTVFDDMQQKVEDREPSTATAYLETYMLELGAVLDSMQL
jgi:hypothetical protein